MSGTLHTSSCHKRLTDLLQDHFNGTFIPAAAYVFDERETDLQKAIRIIIPVFITNLREQLDAGQTAIFQIAREFAELRFDEPANEYLTNGYILNKGGALLAELFGDRLGNTVNAISAFTTVKSSSVHSLFSLCTSSALSGLGQAVKDFQFDEDDVKQYLAFSPDDTAKRVPASFSIFFRKWLKGNRAEKDNRYGIAKKNKVGQSFAARILPTLLIIVLVFLVFFVTRDRNLKRPEKDTMTNDIHVIGIKSTP